MRVRCQEDQWSSKNMSTTLQHIKTTDSTPTGIYDVRDVSIDWATFRAQSFESH